MHDIFWSSSNFLPYPANGFYGRPFFPLPRRWRWISRLDLGMLGSFNHGKKLPNHVRFRISVSYFFQNIWLMLFFFCMVSKFGWFQIGVSVLWVRSFPKMHWLDVLLFVSHGNSHRSSPRWNLESWSSEKYQKTILVGEIFLLVTQW